MGLLNYKRVCRYPSKIVPPWDRHTLIKWNSTMEPFVLPKQLLSLVSTHLHQWRSHAGARWGTLGHVPQQLEAVPQQLEAMPHRCSADSSVVDRKSSAKWS